MSKVKRILSVIMAMVMVLAMSVPTFAETGVTPTKDDKLMATVKNVEAGARVEAYQIVKGDYNSNGFIGYVKSKDSLGISDVKAPTSEEVTKIAADLGDNNALNLKKTTLSATEADATTYKAELEAGYWIVLVRGTTKVYNPMLIGVYYTTSGSDNTMKADPVDATKNWMLAGTDAYAKSSDITIEKTAFDTADIGDEVEFTVTAKVPDYSAEYSNVKYEIKDTLTNLTFAENLQVAVTVSADHTITSNDYTVTRESDTQMKVEFTSAWVKANGLADITLKYKATMTGDAVNEEAHSNKAELNYTNNPGQDAGHTEDTENVYTFDIDGTVTGDILKKVRSVNGENVALPDAEFTLYTDEDCTNRYYNTKHTTTTAYTAKSDSKGKLYITGLDQGTYYLKETKAPDKFTLNSTVYKIEVKAVIENEVLKSWNVDITPLDGNNNKTSNSFTVAQGTATAGENNQTTDIMNTEISTLPSTGGIGTTIFTIGGCAIMIVAAGLFFATRRKTQK